METSICFMKHIKYLNLTIILNGSKLIYLDVVTIRYKLQLKAQLARALSYNMLNKSLPCLDTTSRYSIWMLFKSEVIEANLL